MLTVDVFLPVSAVVDYEFIVLCKHLVCLMY